MGGQSRHQHYAHDWTVGVQAPALASASAGEGPKSRRRTVRRSPRPSATPPRLARPLLRGSFGRGRRHYFSGTTPAAGNRAARCGRPHSRPKGTRQSTLDGAPEH